MLFRVNKEEVRKPIGTRCGAEIMRNSTEEGVSRKMAKDSDQSGSRGGVEE